MLQMCSIIKQIARALFTEPEARSAKPDWKVPPAVLAVTRQNSEPNWIAYVGVQILLGPKGTAARSDER
jgi:hypothetical protein